VEHTALLLREYAQWRRCTGLEDDSLCRKPGVFCELRRRHTMRLLDPRDAVRHRQQQQRPAQLAYTQLSQQYAHEHAREPVHGREGEQPHTRLTFLELHTPSMWRTARDRDGCPVVYTNMEQYQHGASEAVESTFVWILETVCREMDANAEPGVELKLGVEPTAGVEAGVDQAAAAAAAHDRAGDDGGKFSILLDLSTCAHVRRAAFFSIGMILSRAVKKGFRGRLHRFYIYPAGRIERWLLRGLKPFLGKYTLPKVSLIPPEERARLVDIFGPHILPEHLGGTSRLLSVELASNEEEMAIVRAAAVEVTAAAEVTDVQEGHAAAAAAAAAAAVVTAAVAEVTAATAGGGDDKRRRGHDDIKWFLKGPGLNFAVLGIITACSIHFAPGSRSNQRFPRRVATSSTRGARSGAGRPYRSWSPPSSRTSSESRAWESSTRGCGQREC